MDIICLNNSFYKVIFTIRETVLRYRCAFLSAFFFPNVNRYVIHLLFPAIKKEFDYVLDINCTFSSFIY